MRVGTSLLLVLCVALSGCAAVRTTGSVLGTAVGVAGFAAGHAVGTAGTAVGVATTATGAVLTTAAVTGDLVNLGGSSQPSK
jgi:hypothetical protein